MPQPSYRFVLFGTEFSGGRMVIDLLRRVADARYGPLPSTWNVESLLKQRHFFPLRHIQRHGGDCSDYLFGFKLSAVDLMNTHGMNEPHRFMELLYEQGYKLIYLQRRDLMRHAIAILKAQQPNGQPNSRHIDPQELVTTIKRLDDQRIAEATIIAQVPHLKITYETDLIDPNVHNVTAQRLCRFLSLQPRQQTQYSMKLVHQRISDLVTNYDEICAILEHSDYAYVLTEASAKLVI
ncbi:hypothetical protein IXB50_03100 [Leptothoe spongobia TAU-MAC 1115]|uniref:Uncharacterized protein n=2 Tax=Leptothoe TaxID=2651725 RepID=A0A947DC14_9CYAN|nr:hypothetical protein [Leptothoe spongobia TAU-MAC 1115]